MEGRCEYIEQAVTSSQKGVVLQLGHWVGGQQPLTIKNQCVKKHYTTYQTPTDSWNGLSKHNEELHDLHLLSNIVRVIKSRRMRLAWHVARMAGIRNAHKISVNVVTRQ
jgi:hypothetical protein